MKHSEARLTTGSEQQTRDLSRQNAGHGTESLVWQGVCGVLLTGLAIFFFTTWYSVSPLSIALKLMFLALLVLTLKRWTGAVLLGFVQIHLLLDKWASEYVSFIDGLPGVVVPIAMVALVSRFRTLQDLHRQSSADTLQHLTHVFRHREHMSEITSWIRNILRQLVRSAVVISVCLLTAAVILKFVPLHVNRDVVNTVREFRLQPAGYRVIMTGLVLFTGWLIAWLFVNEFVWRKLLPQQAGIYLRSVFLDWSHRDFRMIVRKRVKVRRKRMRAVRAADAKATSDVSPGQTTTVDAFSDVDH